ncbi:MAG: hypothetical protein LBD03_02895 [Methanobrevibacter sp.]|nr:hypothetical protein [Candidatus Methanovirga procula]
MKIIIENDAICVYIDSIDRYFDFGELFRLNGIVEKMSKYGEYHGLK